MKVQIAKAASFILAAQKYLRRVHCSLTRRSKSLPSVAGRRKSAPPFTSDVEAVGKPHLRKMRKGVRNLALQNRLHGAISLAGIMSVPPYLPRALRRGLFLQPR